jgi:hypothetical protein
MLIVDMSAVKLPGEAKQNNLSRMWTIDAGESMVLAKINARAECNMFPPIEKAGPDPDQLHPHLLKFDSDLKR